MDRLTNPNGDGFIACNGCEKPMCTDCDEFKAQAVKLADYEDTGLTPAEVMELAQAKADGRLVVLPCKLGRVVYIIDNGKIERCITEKPISHGGVIAVGVDKGYGIYRENIGKTAFLTRSEAQAALDRMEGRE